MQDLEQDQILNELTNSDYKYGFTTNVETETIPKGLNEDIIRLISAKKSEPDWLLEFRLKSYRHWLTMKVPDWAHLNIPEIDFQDIIYYADPRKKKNAQKQRRR
jgi:Iron-regulated ABC transporter membrane component SufB